MGLSKSCQSLLPMPISLLNQLFTDVGVGQELYILVCVHVHLWVPVETRGQPQNLPSRIG